MDQLDLRRIEHAEQSLSRGKAALSTDLKNGMYWIKSGLTLKATTLLKNDSPDALSVINDLVESVGRLSQEHELSIAPSEQNELIFLSLFAKNRDAAVRLASLNTDRSDTYPFTLAVRGYLAAALSVPSEPQEQLGMTSAEAKLLNDLRSIVDGHATDFSGADAFWSSLRKKRFANTIFEHKNIFKSALTFLQAANNSFKPNSLRGSA